LINQVASIRLQSDQEVDRLVCSQESGLAEPKLLKSRVEAFLTSSSALLGQLLGSL